MPPPAAPDSICFFKLSRSSCRATTSFRHFFKESTTFFKRLTLVQIWLLLLKSFLHLLLNFSRRRRTTFCQLGFQLLVFLFKLFIFSFELLVGLGCVFTFFLQLHDHASNFNPCFFRHHF